MKIDETTEPTASETETEAQPRKLLLGKRVLRHFNVKSSIQTGRITTQSDSQEDPGTYSIISRRDY